jgi:hypothetical protein
MKNLGKFKKKSIKAYNLRNKCKEKQKKFNGEFNA